MTAQERNRRFYLFVFLWPCLIYIFFWRIGPLSYTIFLSFTKFNFLTQETPSFIGAENYRRIFLDPAFQHSLGLAFLFMGLATFFELMIGLGLAVLFDRPLRAKSLLTAIFLIPMVLTPVVVGVAWYILYHDIVSPINQFLKYIGFAAPGWISSRSTVLYSIIIADIWQWTPFMFLLLLAGLQAIPGELYEAAKVDGASGFTVFRHITLPLMIDVIWVSVILRSMDAFTEFDKIWIMTRGGPGTASDVVSIRVYKTAFQYFEAGYAAAMVIFLLIIVSSLYFGYLRLSKE